MSQSISKAPITHRCNATYEYGIKCTMARHADGTFSGIGCGEPCSWIMGKSGHGEPPWQTLEGNIRRDPCEPDEGYKSKSINSDGTEIKFKSTLEIIAEALHTRARKDAPMLIEWNKLPELYRNMSIEMAKAALEAMRVLVKNDPKGCMADDEILQNYIDTALK